MALIGPHELRDAEAAQRTRRRPVGVERRGIDIDVLDVVRPRRCETGFLRYARADIGIGAAVPPDLAFPARDAAVRVDGTADAERVGVLGDGVELLLHGLRHPHRTTHQHRQRQGQRLHLDVDLCPEPAAKMACAHPHITLRPAEQARHLVAHEGWALRRGMDRHPVVTEIGDGDHRLEGRMHRLLRAEGMLEDVRRVGEGPVRVAEPQMEVERDVGVPLARQMLQIGEGPGGLQLLVHDGFRGQRFDLVIDRRQFLVIDRDQPRRPFRDMRIARQHGRDRLAEMPHLVERQDRLVVKGRPVIGFRQHRLHVFAGHHHMHARHRRRFADID